MTPNKIDRFHRELEAAAIAQVPLELFTGVFKTAANVAKLKTLRSQLGQTPANPFGTSLNQMQLRGLPPRYRAALQVFEKSDSIVPVLDGLSVRQRVMTQLAQLVRSPLAYLLVMLFIASVGLHFFANSIVPSFDRIRADMVLPLRINSPERSIPTSAMVSAAIALSFTGLLGWLLFLGGSARIALCLGGRHYLRCQVGSSAIRTVEELVAHGAAATEAVGIACDLVGADKVTREQLQRAVDTRDASHGPHQLSGLLQQFQSSARNRLAVLRTLIPLFIVSVLGGLLTVGYCVALFLPLVNLIHDLTIPGT